LGGGMKKRLLSIVCCLVILFYANSCTALSEGEKREYGSLIAAVTYSKSAVKGEFGHAIPPEFDAEEFMEVVKGKIPDRSYRNLQKYQIQIVPKEGYFLIKVYEPRDGALILFDYSCNLGVEGRVMEEPGKYDINNLQLYDKCQKVIKPSPLPAP
jgi:hypothetical protein